MAARKKTPARKKAPARRRAPRRADLPGHAAVLLDRLLAEYPEAHCALDFHNAYELLVATILSAQCTDKQVNLVTPALFARYPDAAALATARQEDVEQLIKSAGFFRTKAKNLIGMANGLVERHGGEVPADMDALVALPGVGRKTANVILGNAFGIPGITIDTHFGRLARRFAWTVNTDPVKVEADIAALFPPADWTLLSHRVIWHGRRVCHARKPACGACAIAALCPSFGEGPTDPDVAAKLVKSPEQVASAL